MLHAILTLVALQLVGDLIADVTSLPVPGVVIGLVLLLVGLWIRRRVLGDEHAVPEELNRLSKGLHAHLGLLFVPAGAGVMANVDRLAEDGAALFAAVLISTAATIAVTALIVARCGTERTVANALALR
jgi:holin-like protein